jgi:ATP/maltotriose-dependent transcriptional regulator MalT/DNA-binding SARP family transcriptional activator
VIAAKCRVPPVAARLVARPRLERLIAEMVAAHRPVFVSATAGAGKTTAVIQALDRVDLPTAWLTLDETDAAPGRLLTYLEATLASAVPGVAGVVAAALRRRLPHREAAGLLAEATAGSPVILVVDELERLAAAPEALGVLGAFVRYAPPGLRIVLVGRETVALELPSEAAIGGAAGIGESDLAFTTDEAEAALETTGSLDIDAAAAVEATGGWVAGVLFEAWRSADHVAGLGGEADPLHGYLASQVFERLDPDEQDLLVSTALLPEVTVDRAEALGLTSAAATLASLHAKHLPVSWRADGRLMRCHTRFREYLLVLLERRPLAEVAALRRGYGEILDAEGHGEDAVEAYLAAGALESALRAAEGALDAVVERCDFAVAERWLAALRPIAPAGDGELTRAELMLAIARERYAEGASVADRLAEVGELELLTGRSERAASMMAWCLGHVGRIAESRELAAVAGTGEEAASVHYLLRLVEHRGRGRSVAPEGTGGPLDALIMRVLYAHGRLHEVAEPPPSPWAAAVSAPWRIGALRAMGRLEEALELYEEGGLDDWAPVWFHAMVEPELMIDLGRAAEARSALKRGRELVRESGSVVFDMLNRLIEAKLELRLSRDHERADALLLALAARPEATEYGFIDEQVATWAGMVLLLRNQDEAAARRLRKAVRSMQSADRILELPTAAVLLAEAEWRLGNEEQSDRAADVALEAATRQGSNHILLQALADFPNVASRRMDADADADSPWHELTRSLLGQDAAIGIPARASVVLDEFGGPALVVDGEPVRPRIKKSYLLLAFLLAHGGRPVPRRRLLDALFDGRTDPSARSYLRQAAHQLRDVLPEGVTIVLEDDDARLVGAESIQSEYAHVEDLLARSAHAPSEARGRLIEQALAILDRGRYLGKIEAPWVEERRERLARRAADARHEAAKAAFAAGRFQDAWRQAALVVEHDPYRESSWRLLMRIASALGDENGVIDLYRRCERALDELGTRPAATTNALLQALRK